MTDYIECQGLFYPFPSNEPPDDYWEDEDETVQPEEVDDSDTILTWEEF